MLKVEEHPLPSVLRTELPLWVGAVTTALFIAFGDRWLADLSNLFWYSLLFFWLFTTMLWLAFGVVRHADALAIVLGEPYGTIVLTLSVISIEVVMIAAVMLTGEGNPTLARDTLFSVLMIVLNGTLGVTLLLGGLRHGEQSYNLRGVFDLAAVAPLFRRSPGGAPVGSLQCDCGNPARRGAGHAS